MNNFLLKEALDKYKIVNFVIVMVAVIYLWGYPVFIESGGCVEFCAGDLKQGVLDPLYLFLQYFIYLLVVFLVLPARYFRRWLLYIASWGLPVLFILAATSSVRSSGIMTGRAVDVQIATIIFIFFSAGTVLTFALYDLWQWYRLSKKK